MAIEQIDPIFTNPPRNKWGDSIVPHGRGLRYTVPFYQSDIDTIGEAWHLKESILSRESASQSNLSRRIHARVQIPWGPGLLNRASAIKQINTSLHFLSIIILDNPSTVNFDLIPTKDLDQISPHAYELRTLLQIQTKLENTRASLSSSQSLSNNAA